MFFQLCMCRFIDVLTPLILLTRGEHFFIFFFLFYLYFSPLSTAFPFRQSLIIPYRLVLFLLAILLPVSS